MEDPYSKPSGKKVALSLLLVIAFVVTFTFIASYIVLQSFFTGHETNTQVTRESFGKYMQAFESVGSKVVGTNIPGYMLPYILNTNFIAIVSLFVLVAIEIVFMIVIIQSLNLKHLKKKSK